MNRYRTRIEAIADVLKRDGLDYWAVSLNRATRDETESSGTNLALKWRKILLQLIEQRSLSDETRGEVTDLIAEFDRALGYTRNTPPQT